MKAKICIVTSTYNSNVTFKLLDSAKRELQKSGISKIKIIKVPGSFEIPVVISKLAKSYDGFIAIGCIVKGETANFDLISNAITNGIMRISIDQKKPIGNAIITAFNKKQALNRFIRGKEAAKAIVEILKLK